MIGLARAGLGLARALYKTGAHVTAYDQKSADHAATLESADVLAGLGIEVVTSWSGVIDWDATDILTPSPGVPKSHPTLVEAATRGVPIHSEIEVAYRISAAPIIAITGTNGKSTVTALTWHMLQHSGANAILCGNIAGSGFKEQPLTTAAAAANERDVLVAEVSSFQLEWVDLFKPRAATIIQITPDHLDRYSSFDEYASTKRRIFDRMDASDTVVIHADREITHPSSSSPSVVRRIGSSDSEAILTSDRLTFVGCGTQLDRGQLWMPGAHNLENCAFAALLANCLGAPIANCVNAAATFKGLENRMEFVAEQGGVRFINNSMCTNPVALYSSISAIGEPVLLLAGGVSKVDDMGPITDSAQFVKHAFLFGRDRDRLEYAFRKGGCSCDQFETMEAALEAARKLAVPGDHVVLAPGCASFDQFESFVERGERFKSLVLGAAHVD